jgi:hypothetical protein
MNIHGIGEQDCWTNMRLVDRFETGEQMWDWWTNIQDWWTNMRLVNKYEIDEQKWDWWTKMRLVNRYESIQWTYNGIGKQ